MSQKGSLVSYGGFRWLVERYQRKPGVDEHTAVLSTLQDISAHHPTDVQFAESPLFPQILAYFDFDWKRMTAAIKEAIG